MGDQGGNPELEKFRKKYPEKFAGEKQVFSRIHKGSRIFIGTACAEPQYLVNALVNYVESPAPSAGASIIIGRHL